MVKINMVNLTNKILLCLVIIFCTIRIGVKAQILEVFADTLPYLQELRQALFPSDESKISAKDHPNCIEEEESRNYREWTTIDTIIMVRLNQPDKKQFFDLLLKIAKTKNYAYFKPLMAMYE